MKIDLDIQELRLIESGLELRNAHNIRVMNGNIYISKHAIEICEKECNEIDEIKKKIKKAYTEIEVEKNLNEYKTQEENEKMYEMFISGFIGIDISKALGFSVPVTITKG